MRACRLVPEPEMRTVMLKVVEAEYWRDRSVATAEERILTGRVMGR